VLLYAYAAEPAEPILARGQRSSVRGWASLASFLSDEYAVDFIGDARHARLKENLKRWSDEVRSLGVTVRPSPELDKATEKIFDEYFSAA
jgi:hypothetical protein